jgi:hypothetical protein
LRDDGVGSDVEWKNQEFLDALNAAQRRIAEEIRQIAEHLFYNEATINISAAATDYALPADFVRAEIMYEETNPNNIIQFMPSYRDVIRNGAGVAISSVSVGSASTQQLRWHPDTSLPSKAYILVYEWEPADMALDADQHNLPTNLDEMLIKEAVIEMKARTGELTQAEMEILRREWKYVRSKLRTAAVGVRRPTMLATYNQRRFGWRSSGTY